MVNQWRPLKAYTSCEPHEPVGNAEGGKAYKGLVTKEWEANSLIVLLEQMSV